MSSLAASFSELTRQLASGELTAVELARQSLDQIAHSDGEVKAFLHVDREGTLAQASEVDRRRAAGTPLGALAGIPIAIKDVICVAGQTTT
ncbi:MAG: amidase family protein, partial [Planctomycetaceae bacterium]